MQVRTPRWDFSRIRAHWAPANPEFAQTYNASSLVPAHLEPYLVKVMAQAMARLGPEQEQLRTELGIFIKQEMQHCKQHIAYNKAFRALGYEEIEPMEAAFAADFDRFLKEKSLRFNCAYSEGFEAMSSIAVSAFFEDYDDLLEGADPEAAELWRWHLAEEFEHREVAHDVYHALFGKNPVAAYFYRIYGFFYATLHLTRFSRRVAAHLIDRDRQGMSVEELAQSMERQARVKKATVRATREHILEILSPFYKPGRRRVPRGVPEVLSRYAPLPAA